MGVDPLTHNRYTYVNGDPVNLIDPDGHRHIRPATEQLNRDHAACFGALNCTLSQFESMTLMQRTRWLSLFENRYEFRYGITGWFENIKAVLTFADEKGLGRSEWFSLIDAAILQAIQEGMARAEGLSTWSRSCTIGESRCQNAGGDLWRTFFVAARQTKTWSADWRQRVLKPMWGVAEQAGTDYGLYLAEVGRGLSAPSRRFRFLAIELGNFYRAAVGDFDLLRGLERKMRPIFEGGCGYALTIFGVQPPPSSCGRRAWTDFASAFDPRNGHALYANMIEMWSGPWAAVQRALAKLLI